jgi:hypothetical protein
MPTFAYGIDIERYASGRQVVGNLDWLLASARVRIAAPMAIPMMSFGRLSRSRAPKLFSVLTGAFPAPNARRPCWTRGRGAV